MIMYKGRCKKGTFTTHAYAHYLTAAGLPRCLLRFLHIGLPNRHAHSDREKERDKLWYRHTIRLPKLTTADPLGCTTLPKGVLRRLLT